MFEEPDEFPKARITKIYRMLLQDRPDPRNNARAMKDVVKGLDHVFGA